MSDETIKFTAGAGIARITLNRPERLNSFNQAMHDQLRRALGAVRDDRSLRCLVLSGAGKAFCAGQDLNDRKFDPDQPPDLGDSLTRNYNPLIQAITALEIPVVCAVNGVAAGAGVGLALACDIVLAARSSEFVFSFSRVGLGLDSALSWHLPRLVGLARARALALLGERLPAERAAQWGLIWRCVDDDALAAEAGAMAYEFAARPTRGLAAIKRALLEAAGNNLEQQLELEAALQREAGRTRDYREGVLAFLEKRKPDFRGE